MLQESPGGGSHVALGWVSMHSEDLEIADGASAVRGLGGQEEERTVAGEAEVV